ncbi:aurora kinase-like isoform X1, partial [Clarias magur]
ISLMTMMMLMIMETCSLNVFPCEGASPDVRLCSTGKPDIKNYKDACPFDTQELTCNRMHKQDMIPFIQRKAQECLLHMEEPGQWESYFFWNIMELFCNFKGKVMMSEVAVVFFIGFRCLRKKAAKLKGVNKLKDWYLSLANLLCAPMPEDEHIKAVLDMGDYLATKGLTYAAHLCYVTAYKEFGSDLIGCQSLPVDKSAMMEAIQRTVVYEYVLSLTLGLTNPNIQELRFLYARKLDKFGFSTQALYCCKAIAEEVATFRERATNGLLDQLIQLSEKLHGEKEEEPEWLMNLRLLLKTEEDLLNVCIEQEEHTETPPLGVPAASGHFQSRVREHWAFSSITKEVTARYTIGALLGQGRYSAVYAGVRKADNREVAVKFCINNAFSGMMTMPDDSRVVPIEVGLMELVSKPVSSPYVLELLEWFEIPKYNVLILERPSPCMNLVQFCELHKGKLPEAMTRDIILQVIVAARHCCDCGVFHNDINPGNILINTETLQIKLIDFGSGDLLKDTPYKYRSRTPDYNAPEWYLCREYMARPKTIWSLGVILYEIVCGEVPFKSSEEIVEGHLHFPPGLSEDCCKLISWCLEQNPKSRPNFRQIFGHRWFMAKKSYIQ